MKLTLETRTEDHCMTIAAHGDVDLYSSPELRDRLLDALRSADGEVALDLSGVRYMDSSGVATLVEGLRGAQEHRVRFRLVRPSDQVRKVLQMTRLDSVFEIDEAP